MKASDLLPLQGGYDPFNPATFREPCPYCRTLCECDLDHNGVGFVQVGPFHCTACGASEIGGNDAERELSEDERRTGWYAPGAEPGSSANVIGGRIVIHEEMNAAYRARFEGNPAWGSENAVADWFEAIRKA